MFIPHYVSCATCYVSRVTCHLSPVTCIFILFLVKKNKNYLLKSGQSGQSDGASQWRVCYQRGLPRLVSMCNTMPDMLIDLPYSVYFFSFFVCLQRHMLSQIYQVYGRNQPGLKKAKKKVGFSSSILFFDNLHFFTLMTITMCLKHLDASHIISCDS